MSNEPTTRPANYQPPHTKRQPSRYTSAFTHAQMDLGILAIGFFLSFLPAVPLGAESEDSLSTNSSGGFFCLVLVSAALFDLALHSYLHSHDRPSMGPMYSALI
eukprot:Trichotokara_eunicae@DN5280_c0_g1_i3.p1